MPSCAIAAYILMATAKDLLQNLKAMIVATPVQVVISGSEMYMFLLGSLSGPLYIGWHLLELVVAALVNALNDITADLVSAELHMKNAFLQFNDLDSLVRRTAKRKAELTASCVKPFSEVDDQVMSETQYRMYGSLEPPTQDTVVQTVLLAINSESDLTVRTLCPPSIHPI